MQRAIQKLEAYRDTKRASDFFEKVKTANQSWADLIGFNVFKESFKMFSFQYILLNVWIWTFILLIFNTLYLRIENGFIACLKTAITLGMAFQGGIKSIVFMRNLKFIKRYYMFGVEFLDSLKNPSARLKSRNYAFGGWLFLNYGLKYAYTLAVCSSLTVPLIYSFIFYGKVELPFDIKLPFLESNSFIGFSIYMAYLSICAAYMLIGLQTGDAFYSLLLLNGFIQIENIFVEIDNLNLLIESTKSQYQDIVKQLHEVLKLHQNYIEYIQFLASEFSIYFTATVVTMVFQVVLSLYLFYAMVSKLVYVRHQTNLILFYLKF